jgi:hypothetical protein
MSDQPSTRTDPTFDPAVINTYLLYNDNYNVIPVKIRLKGASDPGAINLNPGNQLAFNIGYSNGKAKFYYTGKEVQMIDLNNGSSADDLNAPNSDNNSYNTLRYAQGNPQGFEDVINFDSRTYVTSFGDQDGIAGGVRAQFKQSIQGNAIQAAIVKA